VERTTVFLDAALKRRLRRAAAERDVTEASLIREALERHLGPTDQPMLQPVGESRDGGVADRVDDALADLGFAQR
jgi:hypothetical protein